MKINGIEISKILEFAATPGFGKWKKYFPTESVAHPAKANLNLLQYLIQTYTKEGDTVCDPMSGSGSTGVISALNNRNCIQVELEEKFFNWMEGAREKVEKTPQLTKKGKIINIHGDSRNLSELLKEHEEEISHVLFSPPYGNIETSQQFSKREIERRMERGIQGAVVTEDGKYMTGGGKRKEKYSDNPNNIGNLPFNADCIVTSPPFAGTSGGKGEKSRTPINENYPGLFERCIGGNKGALSDNLAQIDNLPFDAAIFSPPYSLGHDSGDNASEEYKERLGEQRKHTRAYSIGNIAKLPFISAILFSPPYFASSGIDTEEAMKRRLDKIFVGRSYVPTQRYDLDRNIGNLKDFGVDAVLTSPPYEGSLSSNKESPLAGGDEEKYGRRRKGTAKKHSYTQHGEPVDGTITRLREHGRTDDKAGGPYGKSLGHSYSSKEENIGNLKSSKEEYEAYQNKKDKKKGKSETYLEAMKTVYEQCFSILKPHGLLILILKNFIRDKKVIPLTEYTIKLCESVGFKLKQRLLFRLPQKSFWRVLYEKRFPEVNTSDLQYEHVIIFEK